MFTATARLITEKVDFRPALLSLSVAGSSPEKMMATYWEKLKDPRWQKRRLEIMARADFSCEYCDDKTTTLNVHHKRYKKGADPWDYEDNELECLCENCHSAHHQWRERLDLALCRGFVTIEQVVGYVDGMTLLSTPDRPEEYKVKIESYEHAHGIADAFRLQVDDALELALSNDGKIVDGAMLWELHQKRWGR